MTTRTLTPPLGTRGSRVAPGPPGSLLLGNVRALQKDPLGFFSQLARDYGDVARIRLGPDETLVIHHPDHVKQVLADHASRYEKQQRFVKALRPVMGYGLLINGGDFWKRQRRIANPIFHKQRIGAFGDTFVRSAAEAVGRWRATYSEGTTFDLAAELQRLTLTIVGRTLFSMELGGEADRVGPAVAYASRYVLDQLNALFQTPTFAPTPGNLRFKAAIKTLDEVVFQVIDQRRSGKTYGNDLLALLLEARDEETGEGMTTQQLRDELMTFYLAGHETVSNTLAWTFYLLGKNPAAEAELRDELQRVLGGRRATLEDAKDLTFTGQVIEEAMRLYPPGWLIGRSALEADEIGGYPVKPGTQVLFSACVTHSDPRFWEDPEAFVPARFAPERAKARPAYAYYPFSGGTRKCIGAGFAMLEMQLVLATVMQGMKLQLEPGFKAEMYPGVTLMPTPGIRVTAASF